MSEPSRQSRSWRSSLKAWWQRSQGQGDATGSETSTPALAQPPTWAAPPLDGLGIPMPSHAPERLAFYASRYFNYAEDLTLRGAPDLAAPFYRQAYALQVASSQSGPYPSAPTSHQATGTVNHQSPEAPQQRWSEQLQQWREQLNPSTAPAIQQQLDRLQSEGIQNPEVHNLRGLSALMQKDDEGAESSFQAGLNLDPRHYNCLINMAGLQVRTGRSAQAIPLLKQALGQTAKDDSKAVPALNNLALAHQQLGQTMEAALLVHRIHKLKPGHLRPARLEDAAQTLEQMGEDLMAIELLRWLERNQPSQATLKYLATLLERRGDMEDAALVYRKALRPDP